MTKTSKKKKLNKKEQAFAKYLIYAAYLFIVFFVITVIQLLLGAIFPFFSGTAAWSLFITLRLLAIMLAAACALVFFIYLILYALKEEN